MKRLILLLLVLSVTLLIACASGNTSGATEDNASVTSSLPETESSTPSEDNSTPSMPDEESSEPSEDSSLPDDESAKPEIPAFDKNRISYYFGVDLFRSVNWTPDGYSEQSSNWRLKSRLSEEYQKEQWFCILAGYEDNAEIDKIFTDYGFVDDEEYLKEFCTREHGFGIPKNCRLGYATGAMIEKLMEVNLDISITWMCEKRSFEVYVAPKYTLIDKETYTATDAFYTDKLRNDGIYPGGGILTSYEAFHNSHDGGYDGDIPVGELHNYDRTENGMPSYREWIQKYDEAYFEENAIIKLVIENDANHPPKVESLYLRNDDTLEVFIDNYIYSKEWDEDQVFHILIEIPKEELLKLESRFVSISHISKKPEDLE